jgi:phosphoglycerate kinase
MSAGLKGIKTIRDFDLKDKVLFLRLDLNVPIENGKITDDTRIRESLKTIRYAVEHEAKIIISSHLGRPKTAADKQYSLEPVARKLSEELKMEVLLSEEPNTDGVKALLVGLKKNQIILLENLRFFPGETKNSVELAQEFASYSDIYINDAFGASHRAHASIHALPELMTHKGIGFLIEKEINMLDQLISQPVRPYVAILGGAKVSDKIGVIEKLLDIVDVFIIGGAMAYTFLKSQGHNVGKSLVETDKVKYAGEIIERVAARGKTILLPVDHVVTANIKDTHCKTTSGINIDEELMGVDIGPATIRSFSSAIAESKTIFWNGPMGVFETPEFSKGTFAIAKAVAENKGTKIVGGGDSASAANMSGHAAAMTHISTGGGASLEYLQGDKLPGLEIVRVKVRN